MSLLSTVGIPALIKILSEALGVFNDKGAQKAKEALDQVGDTIAKGQMSESELAEAHRHIEKMTELHLLQRAEALSEVNQSLRAEIASHDKYVRRMRPTFGYLMAATWAAQMFGVAYIIIFKTAQAALVLNAMASLTTIWGVGLSVLGIYVYKRSEDKRTLSHMPKTKPVWQQAQDLFKKQ